MSAQRKQASRGGRALGFFKTLVLIVIAIVVMAVIAGSNGGLGSLFEQARDDIRPTTAGEPAAGADQASDYVKVLGTAQRDHEVADGAIEYCPLDDLGRASCAYGELTKSTREDAQKRGRQDIDVDPSGWTKNTEVEIPALSGVEGSKAYSGWMWNRSHLLADSLGGEPSQQNLVTGTRTQNVGSTQTDGEASGGMAYTERIARNYLGTEAAATCPLYYAATPNYQGSELIPRTVTVDIQTCDKSIDERVEVSNTANGYTIDYTTGAFQKAA